MMQSTRDPYPFPKLQNDENFYGSSYMEVCFNNLYILISLKNIELQMVIDHVCLQVLLVCIHTIFHICLHGDRYADRKA